MVRTPRTPRPNGHTNPGVARSLLRVVSLLLGVGMLLFSASPVHGRWLTPDMLAPPDGAGGALAKSAASPGSEPESLDLPDQARVPVLMYHYISELPPGADVYRRDLTVTPANFRAQLQVLADAGYTAITLTDLYLHLTQGYPLPEKPVVLTIDDGYRDAYEGAFPILLEYGFTATFFVLVTPTHYESDAHLTWSQMREMAEAGMDIQGHGRDHVDLRGRSYEFLVYQILGTQEAIQYHTGRPARFFCYPSGKYDSNVVAVLESAGYWGAVTTEWGQTHTREGLYEMPRIRIRGSTTLESFVSYLEDR
jgi:peptidoglycan/xylan/chitin deacetylase (PgdA/CDA1 family)